MTYYDWTPVAGRVRKFASAYWPILRHRGRRTGKLCIAADRFCQYLLKVTVTCMLSSDAEEDWLIMRAPFVCPTVGQYQTPSETQTDRHQESNLVHFSLKMWHMVAKNFNDFPNNQLTKFCVFIGWFRILPSPSLNFYEASRFVHP